MLYETQAEYNILIYAGSKNTSSGAHVPTVRRNFWDVTQIEDTHVLQIYLLIFTPLNEIATFPRLLIFTDNIGLYMEAEKTCIDISC
jgi:hypothetical protein